MFGGCCGLFIGRVATFITTVILIDKNIIQNFSRQELTSFLLSALFLICLCVEVGMVISSIPKVSSCLEGTSSEEKNTALSR